jgi:hypothetical protein
MALSFNFENTEFYPLTEDDWVEYGWPHGTQLRAELNVIVWSSFVIGMGRIRDEEDAREFYERALLWEKVHSPTVYNVGDNGEVISVLSLENCIKAIGYTSNVETISRTKWLKRLVEDEFSKPDATTRKGVGRPVLATITEVK